MEEETAVLILCMDGVECNTIEWKLISKWWLQKWTNVSVKSRHDLTSKNIDSLDESMNSP